jgi:RNA polymerase sigma factor (sigma-70 family)
VNPPPSQFDEENPERRVLARAIRRLPRRYRDVFVLHRFTGMPLEQIAEHLGVEKRVVEARLAGALVRLSRAVDKAARIRHPERK